MKKKLLSSLLNSIILVIQCFGFSITLQFCSTTQVKAQGNLPGGFDHVIEVGRYSDWGKGFLTITDLNLVMIEEGNNLIALTFDVIDEYKNKEIPVLGDLIIEVDGTSAKGWTKEQFYNIVDNRHDTITLKFRTKNPEIHDYITKIYPRYELPHVLKKFGNVLAIKDAKTQPQRRKRELQVDTYEERIDENFDFFPCQYYDYIITSNDPLLDKDILKCLGIPLQRNEKKPDILFTITRDAKESITSSYIPPSSRVVNTGSTTTTRYNFLTGRNDYITRQNNQVIEEGGYTHETKTADIFLEIAALDAKRINDKNATVPPIIWKTTVKRHVINPNFNLNDELQAYASWMTFTPYSRYFAQSSHYYCLFAPTGIKGIENVIQNVDVGSRAEEIGLKVGDKIIKVELKGFNKKHRNNLKKAFKEKGLLALDDYNTVSLNIQILRNNNKINLTLPPSKINIKRFFLVGAK